MTTSLYYKQVELLLEALLQVNKHSCFALKGGTAINLFIREMPRLSIDIDLHYLLIEPRDLFLQNINYELEQLGLNIQQHCHAQVKYQYTNKNTQLSKLLVSKNGVMIKIEPNLILRGNVHTVEQKSLCQKAQDQFLQSIKVNTLSFADLYAGKICAALDRQHPRDLFDIKLLFDHEGITEDLRKTFVIYLACSPRPIHELLQPNFIDILPLYEREFLGMALQAVSCDELTSIRQQLLDTLHTQLTNDERLFLLSLKEGEPNWDLLNIPDIENLPALQWKIMNIKKLEKDKHNILLDKLKKVLQL